ncbi:MAG TPA: hypothetical protein VFV50_06045 [Bdellovibrionales bacterium]|nr:hypothetical protein [Bdellovibrionales bacterium]
MKNFGPVCSAELKAIGLEYFDQVQELGFEETCRLWVQSFPERLNANAFLGIASALDETVWTKATPSHRAAAHNLVRLLRAEQGLPPAKRPKRKRLSR